MIAAALDLGSNTLRLLVAEVRGGDYRDLARNLATPRLGQGLRPGGQLQPGAKTAAREQAQAFVALARELGAESIALAATSACRRASDGRAFVQSLGRDLGLDRAVVLTGEQEAELSRAGVLSRLTGATQGAVVVDVGGGSCEILRLHGDDAFSLPLGAVSLTEAWLTSDPPAPAEMDSLTRAVDQELDALGDMAASRLVATAGTAATVGALLLGMKVYQPGRVNNLEAGLDDLEGQMARLAALPLQKRKQVPGLEPERADIILAGMAILRGLMKRFNLDRMSVMDAGLLEGILLKLAAV